MSEIFGQFDEGLEPGLDHLQITLTDACLDDHWAHSSLISDLLADYYGYLVPGQDGDKSGANGEWLHSIRYLINELMENAVKFRSGGKVDLSVGRSGQGLTFMISNHVAADRLKGFQDLLAEICSGNPEELLLEKIEQNALDPDQGDASGLGFLTLMNDYGVSLGWRFTPHPVDPTVRVVHTMARIYIS